MMTGLTIDEKIIRYNALIKLSIKIMGMWQNGNYEFKNNEIEYCKRDIEFFKAMKKKYKKDFEQMKDAAFGGALALQSTRLLTDRTPAGMINNATGFVGIGVSGAMANVAFDMVSRTPKKKRRYK